MNPYIRTNEREIDLLDLGRYLLKRIGWILLAGIVCACIVGVFQFQRTKSADSDNRALAEAEAEYLQELKKYEEESELIIMSDQNTAELMRNQKEYLKTAPLMQLDPYHVWRAESIIQVVSRDEDYPAWQLEELYKSELPNEEYLRDLAKDLGTDWSYLRELISVSSAGSGMQDVVLHEADQNGLTSSRVFAVRTYGTDEHEAQALMNSILEELQNTHKQENHVHPHEMQVLSTVCSMVVDTDLRNRQKDQVSYTQSLLYQINYNIDSSAKLTKPSDAVQQSQEGVSKKQLLKYGLIGFLLGAIVMCVWYTVRYIRNDKLVDYKDIERRGFVLKDLGSISDQGIAMAAANIRNFAGDRKKLFFTGMALQEQFDQSCEKLREYLSEYEVVYARDVLHDPKSREMLINCDAAVLVEQKSVTRYSNLKDETIFLANAEKEIVGVVIV